MIDIFKKIIEDEKEGSSTHCLVMGCAGSGRSTVIKKMVDFIETKYPHDQIIIFGDKFSQFYISEKNAWVLFRPYEGMEDGIEALLNDDRVIFDLETNKYRNVAPILDMILAREDISRKIWIVFDELPYFLHDDNSNKIEGLYKSARMKNIGIISAVMDIEEFSKYPVSTVVTAQSNMVVLLHMPSPDIAVARKWYNLSDKDVELIRMALVAEGIVIGPDEDTVPFTYLTDSDLLRFIRNG